MNARAETVAYIAQSLDGYIARADGGLDWLPEPVEGDDFGWGKFIAGIDTLVLGRGTFEKVLTFDSWPYEGTPVTVLSSTMTSVPEHLKGKAVMTSAEPLALLEQLLDQGCRRAYVDGGKVIHSFLELDLIDEFIVTTIPVLIGGGIPLFGPHSRDIPWSHLSTVTLPAGCVQTAYRRAE